jgi:protein-tyrosine-phosphatase
MRYQANRTFLFPVFGMSFPAGHRTDTDLSRSPMAEAVLKHQITQRPALLERMDIRVDSAGTGAYHAGDDADSRTIDTCRRVSIPFTIQMFERKILI